MATWNGFKGAAKQIEDRDITRMAKLIGVGEDEVHAFMDVEAAGDGFDSAGRPKMLFEPHIFWRLLGAGAKRDKAVKAGLAYQNWKKGYPRDSYPRLTKAIDIDETAALQSASWGFSQVLGSNHRMAGYSTVQAMVKAMMADEENHLLAMINFIKAAGIDDDLRTLAALKRPTTPDDCRTIVRVYNGPKYAVNEYHIKFAKAHNKWRKIPDTPEEEAVPFRLVPQPPTIPSPPPAPVIDKAAVMAAQARLEELSYSPGGIDGKIGPLTRAAILAFRNDNGLPLVDTMDDDFFAALATAKPRKVAPERAEASPATVREAVPEVNSNWRTKIISTVVGVPAAIGGAVTGGLDYIGTAKGYIDPLKEVAADVPGYAWIGLAVIISLLLYLIASHGEKKGVEAFQAGERL